MNSSRPYLLKAFIEWILDNNLTPYLVVNAEYPNVHVPTKYIEDGRIVLNIAPSAIRDYILDNQHIGFNARFAGTPFDVFVPMKAVLAIYAKENGRGMVFKDDEDEDSDGAPPPATPPIDSSGGKKAGKGFLKVIK